MSNKLTKEAFASFERIKHVDDNGTEFWMSRDLASALGYSDYRNFRNVGRKAFEACKNSGINPSDHFVETTDMIIAGKGAERQVNNVKMSRYACYLAVQNADPSKPIVAQAQTYFAIQTRRAEVILDNTPLSEEEQRRLLLRAEMKKHNVQLAGVAKEAGVTTTKDYAVFQNAGYQGLYNGLNKNDIHARKGLGKSQDILDHMGSTELAANLFRATQTEEKLRREGIKGKENANKVHKQVGAKVRKAIKDIGGTMPEDLPVAESIKKLERKEKKLKQIKGKKNKEDEL
ncbi:MAG: DNA damage-inducible protein D [Muribaculaceae bacterium]|nr:DNA damage-inducible protein D [Muribaculaceae bacterium]